MNRAISLSLPYLGTGKPTLPAVPLATEHDHDLTDTSSQIWSFLCLVHAAVGFVKQGHLCVDLPERGWGHNRGSTWEEEADNYCCWLVFKVSDLNRPLTLIINISVMSSCTVCVSEIYITNPTYIHSFCFNSILGDVNSGPETEALPVFFLFNFLSYIHN